MLMALSKSARKRARVSQEAKTAMPEGPRPYTTYELECLLAPERDSIPQVKPKKRGLGSDKRVRVSSMVDVGDKIGGRVGKGRVGIRTIEMATPNTGAHVNLSERGKNAGVKRVQREAPIKARKPPVQAMVFGERVPDASYVSRSIVNHEVETDAPGMRIRPGHCGSPRTIVPQIGKSYEVACRLCAACVEELARP